jgi:hypothetical protein
MHGLPEEIGTAEIDVLLVETLKDKAKDEFGDFDFSRVKKIRCVVFSQGTPSLAQSGRVLVLVVTADGGLLASIQCKHCAKYPGTKVVRKWWDSVGIFMHASNFPKLKPE